MWVAVPTFGELVAPRFGFCDEIWVANVVEGSVVEKVVVTPDSFGCHHRLSRLANMEVEVLLCGGFNRKFLPLAISYGLAVQCGCFGVADEILSSFARGDEVGRRMTMPGFDKTGPNGEGPMTGGGRGRCGLRKDTDDNNASESDQARGRGRGRGRGVGGGRGGGRGGEEEAVGDNKVCQAQLKNQVEAQEAVARMSMEKIPHKIFIMSGKGGVGKTSMTVNLACALAGRGLKVGILDTDLHGPNVVMMTGVEGKKVHGSDEGLVPVQAFDGVKVLSMASFLPDDATPISWRGPRKSAAIRQFVADGNWTSTDVLLVDCPPGTGDEPMTVIQLIPDADGAVVVTSPQEVALLDSRKCINFVRELDQKVIGLVENLSGFVCPNCNERVDLFKAGGGARAADQMRVPFLGSVPISAKMVEAGDSGTPIVLSEPQDPAAKAVTDLAKKLCAEW